MIEDVKWNPNKDTAGAFIYGAQFNKQRNDIIGGASYGSNEFRLFQNHGSHYQYEASIEGFGKGIYSLDFGNTSNKCLFGGGDGIGVIVGINARENKQ